MTQLKKYGQKVETVFELLGNNENAMTDSLGWELFECKVFNQQLAAMLGLRERFSKTIHLRLQEYAFQKGGRI